VLTAVNSCSQSLQSLPLHNKFGLHEQGGYKWTLTKFGFWCFACGYSDLKQLQPLVPGVLNKVIDIEFRLHCRTNRCSVESSPFAAACVVNCVLSVQGPHARCMQFVTAKARLDWVPVPPAYVTTALMMLVYTQAQCNVHCATSMELVSSPRSEGLVKLRARATAA
jgi:hypothetical protein